MSWKMAEVRAVYKQKGSKTDPNNYRPISVLSILYWVAHLKNWLQLNSTGTARKTAFFHQNSLASEDTQVVKWLFLQPQTHRC